MFVTSKPPTKNEQEKSGLLLSRPYESFKDFHFEFLLRK